MGRKRAFAVLAALVGLALVTTACDDAGYSYSGQPAAHEVAYVTQTPRQPSARELAALETAQAEETTAALEAVAKSTADALEIEKRATQQALNLQGTQEAQEAHATREAWAFSQTQEAAHARSTATEEARRATATRQALDATATTEAHQATGTAVQWSANVQGTRAAADAFAVEATRRAVARADEREAATQPFRAWWAWVLLILAVPCLVYLGWRTAKVIEARKRFWQPDLDKGEPVVIDAKPGPEGYGRYGLPYRTATNTMDLGTAPQLPSPEIQEAATMRQQVSNAIQARQTAATVKARKAHKTKAPQIVAQQAKALPRPRPARRRQSVPGLVKVVSVGTLEEATAQGILPPRLAGAIEGEWHVVEDEED